MQDSKLVQLYRLLSSQERRRFQVFLESPYYNKREDIQALAKALEKRFITGQKGGTESELYTFVYHEEPYSASRFNNLKTGLKNLLLQFFSLIEYESDTAATNRYLLQKLNEQGGEKHFLSYYKKAATQLSKSNLPESDLYLEKMYLEEIYNQFQARRPQRDDQDHLKANIDFLGYGFLIRMYKLIIQSEQRKKIVGAELELSWKDSVLEYVTQRKEVLPIIVQGYHALYLTLAQSEDAAQHYSFLRTFLQQHTAALSQTETLNLYTGTLNFAIQCLNDGKLEFLEEIFQLYREMLEAEVILHKGKLSAWHCKNIVHVALRSSKFEWTRVFLKTYRDRVIQDYKHNLIEFCTGLLHFYQAEFDEAERHFYRVLDSYKDVFYGIDCRAYLLQVYYETGNSRGLESLAHSFRMFLDRNKGISQTRRRQNIAFILHLQRLSNIPLMDKKRLQKLKSDIQEKSEKGMGTSWLLEKIEELEQG